MTDPQGGYSLWIELPGNVSGLDLFNHAIREGISLAPGEIFSQDDSFENYIRLDAGCYTDELKPAIKRLGEIINELLFYVTLNTFKLPALNIHSSCLELLNSIGHI